MQIAKRHLVAVLLAVGYSANGAEKRVVSDAEVQKVHRSALLIDTHNDVTSRTVDGWDIGQHATDGHSDLSRFKAGGLGAQFFAVFVAANYVEGNHAANRTLQMIDTVRHDIIEKYPADFAFASTSDDIERIRKQGKIAALLGIEGGHAIEDSLRLLRDYYALGVRYMTLTHSNTNAWADSSGDLDRPEVKRHNGLTPFGREVVREMNRLGMLVDISHVADKTFYDALEESRAPIFASHSSCRALCDAPRNMPDEMIVALAKKGGVVQINFSCDYLSQTYRNAAQAAMTPEKRRAIMERIAAAKDPKERQEVMAKLMQEFKVDSPRPTTEDVVAHIDHVVKIAGIDAVGIGSDFDGVACVPEGLDDVSKYPNLTRALLEHGYSASDIRKVYGGNLLRVMRGVEKAAEPTLGKRAGR